MSEPTSFHRDSYPDMVTRREINDLVPKPVDFYAAGVRKAREFLGDIGESDRWLDVGCSSGEFAIEAANNSGLTCSIDGVDPDPDAYLKYLPVKQRDPDHQLDASRFQLILAEGERLPLRSSSYKFSTAHNALFRSLPPVAMLREMKRTTQPDGLIIVSTNAANHAKLRHSLERTAALQLREKVDEETKKEISIPDPPAKGAYVEDIPRLVEEVGELEIIDDSVHQDDIVAITAELYEQLYRPSLQYSANNVIKDVASKTELQSLLRLYRQTLDHIADPLVYEHFGNKEMQYAEEGILDEPFLPDTVHRRMFVIRNLKPQ